MKKRNEKRSFYFKVYKILCKMLKCDAIVYDVPSKKYREKKYRDMYICVVVDGMKVPLREYDELFDVHLGTYRAKFVLIKLRNCKSMRKDVQKVIVKKIMKVAERSHVVYGTLRFWENPCIKKGTSFEELVVEWDLKNDVCA